MTSILKTISMAEFFQNYAQDKEVKEFYDGVVVERKLLEQEPRCHQQVLRCIETAFVDFFCSRKETPWKERDVIIQGKGWGDQHNTVVSPDLLVLGDSSKDRGHYIEGPPVLIVEVWTEEDTKVEQARKHARYAEAGVAEIWEVFLDTGHIIVSFDEGLYYSMTCYNLDGVATSRMFKGLEVDFGSFDFD